MPRPPALLSFGVSALAFVVALGGAHAGAPVPSSIANPTDEALAADDECLAATGPECALSEMQLRAGKVAAGQAPQAPPAPQVVQAAAAQAPQLPAGAHPVYCQNLPAGTVIPWCEGAASCACQGYCLASVAPANWGFDPNCCGCGPAWGAGDSSATTPVAPTPATALLPPRTVQRPTYCAYLPAGVLVPVCSGAVSCSCQTYCTVSVAPGNWGWDPNCCGCDAAGVTPTPGSLVTPFGPLLHPKYCETLPPGSSAYCQGESSCGCQGYCTLAVSPPNWGWDPNCCGCSTGTAPPQVAPVAPVVPAAGTATVIGAAGTQQVPQQGATAAPATSLAQEVAMEAVQGRREVPLYCNYIPAFYAPASCQSGLGGCACQPFCQYYVAMGAWPYSPECCACGQGAPALSPPPATVLPAPPPPVVTAAFPASPPPGDAAAFPASPPPVGAAAFPAPPPAVDGGGPPAEAGSGAAQEKTQGGSAAAIVPGSGQVPPATGVAPPVTGVHPGGMKHPSYCQNPQAVSTAWCQGESTCMCQSYCLQSVHASNWGYDPNCCGCTQSLLQAAADVGLHGQRGGGKARGGALGGPGLKNPAYCAGSPQANQLPWCQAAFTCPCQGHCNAQSVDAREYDPSCCGC